MVKIVCVSRQDRWVASVLACYVLLLLSQPAASLPIAPQDPAQSKGSPSTALSSLGPNAPPDQGTVDGHTYKNASLGVELTVADDLQFDAPEIKIDFLSGHPLVSATASSQAHNKFSFRKYIVDRAIRFLADPLEANPEDRPTQEAYMLRTSQIQESAGFKLVQGKSEEKIGDVQFSRANFTQGKRRHIVLVTMRKNCAFVLIFVANNDEDVETLIKSTNLKLPE